MKNIATFIMLAMSLMFSTLGIAEDSKAELNQKGQTILETINNLENKGYITNKNALDAKKEFVYDEITLLRENKNTEEIKNSQESNIEVSVFEYFNLINALKTLSVLAFLVFFKDFIIRLFKKFINVPLNIYQGLLVSTSVIFTFLSQYLFGSHSIYISLFCVIANIILFYWIIITHDSLLKFIKELKVKTEYLIFSFLFLYFMFFTIYFESNLIGILSVISFVSLFIFYLANNSLMVVFGFEDDKLINSSIFINGIILGIYSFIKINGINIPYFNLFSTGIEYVVSIFFIIGLLIRILPIDYDNKLFPFFVFLMSVSFITLGLFGSLWYNMSVIPEIINTAFFIFISSWIFFYSGRINRIILSLVVGITLYGFAELIEAFPHLFITNLF